MEIPAAAEPEFYHSAEFEKVYAAFVATQAEFTPVQKMRVGRVKSQRTGAEYTYKYADLADVLAMALPVLTKHGLGLLQPHVVKNGQLRLATRLIHTSGQWLQSYGLPLSENLEPQAFGSLLSYWRRYDVCALLGIAAEDDLDAQGVEQKPAQTKTVRQPGPPAKAPAAAGPADTPAPQSGGEQILAEREKLVAELYKLLPGPELGRRAKAMFPQHQSTKTLTVADLRQFYESLLKERADEQKRQAIAEEALKQTPRTGMPADVPPDVAAMFDEGKITTAARIVGPTIGKGLAQRLHKLIGIHKIHTEAELMEEFLKPLGVEHASDLPQDMYQGLCAWAEGRDEEERQIGDAG